MLPTIVDPLVFAAPCYCEDADSFLGALDLIKNIKNIDNQVLQLLSHPNTAELLAEYDLYPLPTNIDPILKKLALTHVSSSRDIMRTITTIIQKTNPAFFIAGLEDILLESATSNIKPIEEFPKLHHALLELIAVGYILTRQKKTESSHIHVLLSPRYGDPQHVTLDAIIAATEPETEVTTFELPHEFSLKLNVIRPNDYLDTLMPEGLWKSANNTTLAKLAIFLEARKASKTAGTKMPKWEEIRLGGCFFQSLKEHRAIGDKQFSLVTLKTCASILVGLTTNKPFMEPNGSSAGGNKQLIRAQDNSKAWRTHVTEDKQALRMMFWSNETGIELSNIANKKDIRIFK